MAATINALLGDTIGITPTDGEYREVQGIFREEPIETGDEMGSGSVIGSAPLLKLQKSDASDVERGTAIRAGGRDWKALNTVPSGSPDADAFVLIELERVDS